MKFLHMADFHIGITVNGFSMLKDQRYVLEQIISCIKSEQPDVVLLAGDIYDRPNPGANAVNVYDHFLSEMTKLSIPLLVINGNHDSPERLSFAGHILARQQIYTYSIFDGTLHRYTFTDSYGEVHFYMMPFIRPVNVRQFFDEASAPNYQEGIKTVIESAGIDNLQRNVLIAHQIFISENVSIQRSASEIEPAGGLDGIAVKEISGFDYVALGHLHGSQTVGCNHIRYSGSVLKYSPSECHQQKSVTMVELGSKGDVKIKLIPLTPIREMRTIKASLAELLDPAYPQQNNRDDYLLITLTDDEGRKNALGEIRRIYPNVMTLDFADGDSQFLSGARAVTEIENQTPLRLFADFYKEQNQSELSEDQLNIIQTLFERTDP